MKIYCEGNFKLCRDSFVRKFVHLYDQSDDWEVEGKGEGCRGKCRPSKGRSTVKVSGGGSGNRAISKLVGRWVGRSVSLSLGLPIGLTIGHTTGRSVGRAIGGTVFRSDGRSVSTSAWRPTNRNATDRNRRNTRSPKRPTCRSFYQLILQMI